jgi:S-adenosylmethionine hydrolase
MSQMIALMTDYGYLDTYVAQLKAVLMKMAPQATLFDITHGVHACNIYSGAYLLSTVVPYLPEGTVIVAVVDPGVGSKRRAVAVRGTRHYYVAPDNGLLSLALRADLPRQAVVLDNPRYFLPHVSHTFHGRDIFAPVAAHLVNGVPLEQLGSPIAPRTLQVLEDIDHEIREGCLVTHLLHIDRFGNLIFDLHEDEFRRWLPPNRKVRVEFGRRVIPLKRTFSDVAEGKPVAYFGSSGYLEIAVNGGSAMDFFGLYIFLEEEEELVAQVRLQ